MKQKLKTTCGADDQGSFKYYVTLKAKELYTYVRNWIRNWIRNWLLKHG